jgi:hypothetical protein
VEIGQDGGGGFLVASVGSVKGFSLEGGDGGRELVGGGKWSSHSPDVGDLEPDRKGADAEGEKKLRRCW